MKHMLSMTQGIIPGRRTLKCEKCGKEFRKWTGGDVLVPVIDTYCPKCFQAKATATFKGLWPRKKRRTH